MQSVEDRRSHAERGNEVTRSDRARSIVELGAMKEERAGGQEHDRSDGQNPAGRLAGDRDELQPGGRNNAQRGSRLVHQATTVERDRDSFYRAGHVPQRTPPLASLLPQIKAVANRLLPGEEVSLDVVRDLVSGPYLDTLCTAVFDSP